ncbi:MAG: hypothetical protein K5681_06160 [Treponema sp.]|nr:hypothetical protein [Treponema sp.]
MKLEAIFTVKDNQLYKISDNSLVDLSSLKKIEVLWSQVELEPESYNEEFLANLRDSLKTMELTKNFAIIVPKVDKELASAEQIETFITAFNHCARRIKDCISVAGFELPEELTKSDFSAASSAQTFMDTLAIKHAQYVYFTNEKNNVPATIVKY